MRFFLRLVGFIRFFKKDYYYFCAAAGLDLSRAEVVGSGRACQRPRTSSDAKCFSCEGALAKFFYFFKILCCAARGHALAVWLRLVPRRPNALRATQQSFQNTTGNKTPLHLILIVLLVRVGVYEKK